MRSWQGDELICDKKMLGHYYNVENNANTFEFCHIKSHLFLPNAVVCFTYLFASPQKKNKKLGLPYLLVYIGFGIEIAQTYFI